MRRVYLLSASLAILSMAMAAASPAVPNNNNATHSVPQTTTSSAMTKPLATNVAAPPAPPAAGAPPAQVHAGHPHDKVSKNARCPREYAPVAAGKYPAMDCPPFTQDPQVQQWLKEVDLTGIPNFPMSDDGNCPATIHPDQCWWTCQKCNANTDITSCPKKGVWGLSYDDGPSAETPRLLTNLKTHAQTATFFIVGSRVAESPQILKDTYNAGHHIAIHTWSHSPMTSLSNEQLVAELKWTEKIIMDTIGVRPLYMRPPYGDIDNRVRAIVNRLGLKTVIWTPGFDTNDWTISSSPTTQAQNARTVIDTFKTWLTKIPAMPTGFIVLQHDLFKEEVDIALTGILPAAYDNRGLDMLSIPECLQDTKPYREGAGTFRYKAALFPNATTPRSPSSAATSRSSNNRVSTFGVAGVATLIALTAGQYFL